MINYEKLLDEAIAICDEAQIRWDYTLKDYILTMRWRTTTRIIDGAHEIVTVMTLNESPLLEIPFFWIEGPLPELIDEHFPWMVKHIERYADSWKSGFARKYGGVVERVRPEDTGGIPQ